MRHKKYRNFDDFEFLTFFWGWSQMNLEPFLDQKNTILTQKTLILKWKIHGAKHSPLPSSLNRPSADSGGSRASAWFWPFDPILLTQILDRSRNPQTWFQNYIRAWRLLNMSSIGPREDLLRSGNVSQKMSNFWRVSKIWRFLRMIPGQPGTISRPKKQHLGTKTMILK